VLALELFQVGDRLLANEMAPRVQLRALDDRGAETSQFENHLRAVWGCRWAPRRCGCRARW
jgi:5-(carboxyamino)imidazole ribonucleotide synthase